MTPFHSLNQMDMKAILICKKGIRFMQWTNNQSTILFILGRHCFKECYI